MAVREALAVQVVEVHGPAPAAPTAAPSPASRAPIVMVIATAVVLVLVAVALRQAKGRMDQRRAALIAGLLCFIAGFDGCAIQDYSNVEPHRIGVTLMFAAIVSMPGFIVGWLMGPREAAR